MAEKIRPGEYYNFWDTHAYGFSETCRDLVRSDVTPLVKKQVRAALEPMLTPSRNRLLVKITGWPRMGFLNEIFEDAKFIHIVRDGRAVASSLLHVHFWNGWHGPQSWRAGLLPQKIRRPGKATIDHLPLWPASSGAFRCALLTRPARQ